MESGSVGEVRTTLDSMETSVSRGSMPPGLKRSAGSMLALHRCSTSGAPSLNKVSLQDLPKAAATQGIGNAHARVTRLSLTEQMDDLLEKAVRLGDPDLIDLARRKQ